MGKFGDGECPASLSIYISKKILSIYIGMCVSGLVNAIYDAGLRLSTLVALGVDSVPVGK